MEDLEIKFDLPLTTNDFNKDLSLNFKEDNSDNKSKVDISSDNDKEGFVAKDTETDLPISLIEDKKDEPLVLDTTNISSNGKDILKSLFGNIILEQTDEEGNIVDIPIDEIDLTNEQVVSTIKDYYEAQIEDLKSRSVVLDGIDEVRKSMISAIKSGRNPSDILHFQEEYLDPLSNIDITLEKDQIDILKLRYKDAIERGDMTKRDLDVLINGYRKDGELEDRAESAYNQLTEALKQKASEMEKQAQEAEENTKKFYKEYRKEFKKLAQDKLQINEKFSQSLVNFVLDQDENEPRLTKLNAKVLNILRNPEEAVDLSLYVFDKDKYKEMIRNQIKLDVLEEQKKTVRIVKQTNITTATGTSDKGDTKDKSPLFKIKL